MIARSDHRARWAYGLPGLFLVVLLSACSIPVPTVPNGTPDPARAVADRQFRFGVAAQRVAVR